MVPVISILRRVSTETSKNGGNKDISDILKQVGILSNNWYYNKKFAFCYINGIATCNICKLSWDMKSRYSS